MNYAALTILGFFVGGFGTLIGAGGGFILVPALLLLYPEDKPQTITSISLAVVFFNALAGSISYARMKRINYRAGLLFAAAGAPGAVLGACATQYIPRHLFDAAMGVLLMVLSATLLLNLQRDPRPNAAPEGTPEQFTYNAPLGAALSGGVGFFATMLGIGGGSIHVPAMIYILGFPAHMATATSHFILAIMSFSGTATHILTGSFVDGFRRTAFLAIGVVLGAPAGARLSSRIHSKWIVTCLALALALVGVRVLWQAL